MGIRFNGVGLVVSTCPNLIPTPSMLSYAISSKGLPSRLLTMSTFERVCVRGTFARVSFVEQPPFAKHASMLLQKATAFRATLIKALSDAEVSFYVDTVCSHSATWNLNITEFTKGKYNNTIARVATHV